MDPFSQLILAISVTSFFTFQWLFHSVSPWVSTRVSAGFRGLSHKQTIEWNSRTVSTFHALVVGLFCLYILLFDDAINEDPVWGDPTLVKINVGITTGYLISDLLLIFYFWKAIGDKFFVIHHLAALYAYYYVLLVLLAVHWALFCCSETTVWTYQYVEVLAYNAGRFISSAFNWYQVYKVCFQTPVSIMFLCSLTGKFVFPGPSFFKHHCSSAPSCT
ncbi:TLC domain-containing protein 4-B isoform X2 [Conger conger]|uniref:TLC domain-containing protein 4-B isoform X2 n=1 Tax=Conger conger TaxID=82655 RepID=UPI002A5AF90B|nr:TLC domain-containing protein 4-B isoform X2 [Conger conger]